MKNLIKYKYIILSLLSIGALASCGDDEPETPVVMVSANAGIDMNAEPTDIITLDGSMSSVSGATTISYLWEVSAIPNNSSANLSDAAIAMPSFTADVEGDYTFILTVTSGTESSTSMVTVSAIEPMFTQADQMGRPAINTVFVASDSKDAFNTTIPTDMGAAYAGPFETRLLALNPNYTVNALGWDAATMAGALATDVLNADLTSATAFGALNGRTLGDDVITTELTLIFGGSTGAENPTLTDDNVDANDKAFLSAFPYLAAPH